jgi:SAM-dependent methyltransferase
MNEPWWLASARCCRCGSSFLWDRPDATCNSCGFRPHVDAGITVLTTIEDAHKAQQARFFDDADHEFETSRPHGTPPLYRWLLEEKFRRSIAALRSLLPGATVLTVCAGSGMDGEMLDRAGGRVLCSDLSVLASARALERSRRHGLRMDAVVADVEALPFADRSFDLVYVHDGLHHLEDPSVGLAEIARVAAQAVSITEPARATATRIAIRLGAAGRTEEAGNVIVRLEPESIASALEVLGFRVVRVERYGMYYKHEPGPVMRALSAPPVFPIVRTGIRAFNAVLGRIGNKSTVQAVRHESPPVTH